MPFLETPSPPSRHTHTLSYTPDSIFYHYAIRKLKYIGITHRHNYRHKSYTIRSKSLTYVESLKVAVGPVNNADGATGPGYVYDVNLKQSEY